MGMAGLPALPSKTLSAAGAQVQGGAPFSWAAFPRPAGLLTAKLPPSKCASLLPRQPSNAPVKLLSCHFPRPDVQQPPGVFLGLMLSQQRGTGKRSWIMLPRELLCATSAVPL